MKLLNLLLHLILIAAAVSSPSVRQAQAYENTITGLTVSARSVVLANVGYSDYIDAELLSKDGTSQNVSDTAAWSVSNKAVAIVDSGRILGLKKGFAVVTASYGGFKKAIIVMVMNDVNLEKKYALDNGTVLSTTNVSSKTRQTRNQILIRCSDMLNIRWKPSENLLGFDGYIFKAGVYYTGVPYSYTDELCDAQAFEDASTSKYFYKNVVIKNVPQPYYGSDCSGFVTLAWQLPARYDTATFISGIQIGIFAKVGAYDTANPGISDLEKAYAKLQPGDAVVMRDGSHGHTYIIAANEPTLPTPRVFAYEQTPPYVQFTSHTYAEMAAHGFLPFTLKSLK